MVVAYEQARWDETLVFAISSKLSEAQLGLAYDEATAWAQDLLAPA